MLYYCLLNHLFTKKLNSPESVGFNKLLKWKNLQLIYYNLKSVKIYEKEWYKEYIVPSKKIA